MFAHNQQTNLHKKIIYNNNNNNNNNFGVASTLG